MMTKFSLGVGFTPDAVVTDVAKDIPFVSTPNELRALIKTGGSTVTKVEQAKAKHSGGSRVNSAKQRARRGITNLAEVDKGASEGFKRTARRELNENFYTPDDYKSRVETTPSHRTYRSRNAGQSQSKKSAILLLNDIAGTGDRSSSDKAALLQARADFYASGIKAPCTDYVSLFDRSDEISVQEQKDICRTCPLVDKCLKMALLGDESFGVWGGLDPIERAALKRKAMRERRNKALGGIH